EFTRRGTATNSSEVNNISSPGSVSIPANQSSVTITVTPVADNLVEGDETVTIQLVASPSNPPAYSLGVTTNAQVTIADDPPIVSVAANDPNASEPGSDTGQFTISRTGGNIATSLGVTVVRSGTATNATDYTSISANATFTATIPANQASTTINITPINTASVEGDETVVLTLSPSSAVPPIYSVGAAGAATVTIADDEVSQLSAPASKGKGKKPGG